MASRWTAHPSILYQVCDVREAVAIVVAAAIVITAGTGGGNGGCSASIVPWRLTIVRVPPWSQSASAGVGIRMPGGCRLGITS